MAVALKRRPAGEHLVKDRAEREQIRARVDLRPSICSGAICCSVPRIVPSVVMVAISVGCPAAVALCDRRDGRSWRSKSSSFAPDFISMMLPA